MVKQIERTAAAGAHLWPFWGLRKGQTMGLIACFRSLSEADVNMVRSGSELLENYLVAKEPLDGFGPFRDIDIDKAWHGIHFLLTGTTWEGSFPENFICCGGTALCEGNGYGSARVFDSKEAFEISKLLRETSNEDLAARYDPARMERNEIYPSIWDAEGEEGLIYLQEYFTDLRTFFQGAADKDESVIIWVA